MKKERHIKISYLLAKGSKIVHEEKTDIFLKNVYVSRLVSSDEYRLMMGPVEIELPRVIGKEMVEDMLMMLELEDRREILKAMEERI